MIRTRLFLTFALIALGAAPARAETPSPDMKLYRLDCGQIHVSDLNVFSDTDRYVGQEKDLVDSCYLIQKGANWLLWDAGLPASVAENADGVSSPPFKLTMKETLPQQLAKLGLKPEDITHVGISHGHFDHTGQAGIFTHAKLIIQKAEYDLLTKDLDTAKAYHMDAAPLESFLKPENKDRLQVITGDNDLFGDGSLRAISLPGHTPGHMALLVTLPKAGKFILSGDQWHFRENRDSNGVPSFNFNRADTLASSDRLNQIVKNDHARLVIQHEPADTGIIPTLPEYLD